jgi:hypothetical protein
MTTTAQAGQTITLDHQVVHALVADAELVIRISPSTGLHLNHDWWTASVDELHVQVCEHGLDAALTRLTHALRDEVAGRTESPHGQPGSVLALALRLLLADERHELETLIASACRCSDEWIDGS